MAKKRAIINNYGSCPLILFIFFSTMTFSVIAADENKEKLPITGYYYDSAKGKILPRYGHLSPKEIEAYLRGEYNVEEYREVVKGDYTYFYNEDDQLVKSIKIVKDSEGNIIGTYEYNYVYYENGGRKEYIRTDKDGNGNIEKIYKFVYNAAGQKVLYDRTNYDAVTQTKTRHYVIDYDANGRNSQVIDERYDESGNLKASYQYTNYAYYDNGKLKEYTRTDKDGNGSVGAIYNLAYNDAGTPTLYDRTNYDAVTQTKTRHYVIDYDANGRNSQVIDERYDESGNLSISYEYTDYIYDVDDKLIRYTRITRDANGEIIDTYIWSA